MTDINILLVEDNLGDVRLTQESLKECKINNNLDVVYDGQSAMKYLNKEGEYSNSPTPNLILLDLNLPGIKGFELLNFVKTNQRLLKIPVVILTASEAEQDVIRSYQLHANCYICKPIEMDNFFKIVQNITNFWFSIVKLPSKENL